MRGGEGYPSEVIPKSSLANGNLTLGEQDMSRGFSPYPYLPTTSNRLSEGGLGGYSISCVEEGDKWVLDSTYQTGE